MSINVVTLSGRVSRPPKRVQSGDGYAYVFPLAVREEGDCLVFPMVVADTIPEFVTYHTGRKLHEQPLVTVIGRTHTRNLTRPLADDLAAQARRAGAPEEIITALEEMLDKLGLEARHVVTEIVVDSIHEGGAW